eukprot:2770494-Amphidinium_carterae.1
MKTAHLAAMNAASRPLDAEGERSRSSNASVDGVQILKAASMAEAQAAQRVANGVKMPPSLHSHDSEKSQHSSSSTTGGQQILRMLAAKNGRACTRAAKAECGTPSRAPQTVLWQ